MIKYARYPKITIWHNIKKHRPKRFLVLRKIRSLVEGNEKYKYSSPKNNITGKSKCKWGNIQFARKILLQHLSKLLSL